MIVVYGGTFDPPHHGHIACVDSLHETGHDAIVVPSAGHEFKPESRATYVWRKRLSRIAFGDSMSPIEESDRSARPAPGWLVTSLTFAPRDLFLTSPPRPSRPR